MNAKHAWAAIAGWVFTWNFYALVNSAEPDKPKMLSEQMNEWRVKYPWLVYPLIFAVAGHLARVFGNRHDPITNSFGYAGVLIDLFKTVLRGHHG